MKRARWDPVYPFSEDKLIPLPPFIQAGTGLESEGMILSLNFTDPITVNPTGSLTIKIGPGIEINENGQLTATAQALIAESPLKKENYILKIQTNNTLVTEDDKMGIPDPLEPLNIESSGQLSLNFDKGFQLFEGKLSLYLDNSLFIKNEKLSLKEPIEPLIINSQGQLNLNYDNSLVLQDHKLSVPEPLEPLDLESTGQLALSINKGFQISDGRLTLDIANCFQYNSNKLTLTNPTTPIVIKPTGEISLNIGEGLTVDEGNLTLNTNDTLQIEDGQITLTDPMEPLNLEMGQLVLNVDNVFKVENGKLGLNVNSPMSINNNNLNINLGQGLEIKQGALTPKISSPLIFNSSGEITTSTTQGSQIIPFDAYELVLMWQKFLTTRHAIYVLHCTSFIPDTSVDTITFTPNDGLKAFLSTDSPLFTAAFQQVGNEVKTIGVKFSKISDTEVQIKYSQMLTTQVILSSWTATTALFV
ncbi:fiber [Odocoileus adenovirus 1]|uniref:Fiber n=1 Tax=Odocoileus adenovirus 1 TaxID=78522 RepID=A0A223PZ30_9ADEN|nr:fiber [Odocoileus adenovirus 1]ASU50566.1 fiber [Odocoileus adenovirus 1]ASU50593.1 fiber [Odocoileus adenovirus 1]ASU50620.1 fiber [Odocoileus adenovirus 1]WFV29701.1 fiber [Deer atadenovirus A]